MDASSPDVDGDGDPPLMTHRRSWAKHPLGEQLCDLLWLSMLAAAVF